MFREEEAKHLDLEHDDVLVISLKIANALVKMILIDIGSLANILYYGAF